jgi:hypothetical protein
MVKYGVLFEVRTGFLNTEISVLKLSLQDSELQKILRWFQSIGRHLTNPYAAPNGER